jgi:hypothetical protein
VSNKLIPFEKNLKKQNSNIPQGVPQQRNIPTSGSAQTLSDQRQNLQWIIMDDLLSNDFLLRPVKKIVPCSDLQPDGRLHPRKRLEW